MSIILNLPSDLESKLAAQAARHGVSISEYLLKILSHGENSATTVQNGKDLVAYWRSCGIIGTRQEISDSQHHARELRDKAEHRQRS